MYRPEEIIRMFKNNPFVLESEPQIDGYALVPIKQGVKIHVKFDDRDTYFVLTSNEKPLFCNNKYYGGILVEVKYGPDHKTVCEKTIHTFYIRGSAAVLSNMGGEKYITPIGQEVSDLIWDVDNMDWDELKLHFEKKYASLKKNHSKWFKESLDQLRRMDLRIVLINNALITLQ